MVALDDDWCEMRDGHALQIRLYAITSSSPSVRLDHTRLQERAL
jgi:hypothetical protein